MSTNTFARTCKSEFWGGGSISDAVHFLISVLFPILACSMQMSTNSFLGHDVDVQYLAERTKNFSGAEIEGLVKSAASFALNRNVDVNDLHKPLDEDNIKVGGPVYEPLVWQLA